MTLHCSSFQPEENDNVWAGLGLSTKLLRNFGHRIFRFEQLFAF